MAFGGGYESDLNLSNVKLLGDFPIEHSLGGYGIAQMLEPDRYAVTLNPAINQYRDGTPLNIVFPETNQGSPTLNINNKGDIPLKLVSDIQLLDFLPGQILPGKVYSMIKKGDFFQVSGNSYNAVGQASEIQAGKAEIATQVETNQGADDLRIVTPLKLLSLLTSLVATQTEVNAGISNTKRVTPLTLAQYVSDKVTGLWDDKGILDCSLNPNYPAGKKGDAYTVSVAGKIGGVNGKSVEVRDVVYCMGDNAGGNEATVGASWNVIQSNLVQATEAIAGFARIASVAEALAGIDHTTIITPSTLKAAIDNIEFPITAIPIASETVAGVMEIATQAEVNAGADNVRAITPQKLAQYVSDKVTGLWEDKGLLDCSLNPNYPAGQKGDAYTVSVAGKIGGPAGTIVEVRDVIYCKVDNAGGDEVTVGASWNVIQGNVLLATTTIAGIAKIATQADLTAGVDDTKFITPLKLLTYLNAKKMRTQIRFQSDSLPESQVLAAGLADYHFGIIAVTGIPAGSTIRQASLSWEGYIRNDDNANPNSFDAGNFALQKDGSAFSNYINVVGKFQLAAGHVTFFRFVEDDARNLVTGNGTYLAKLGNLSALVGSLSIAGHWTLEIDYETP
jgi:hypothetical protein